MDHEEQQYNKNMDELCASIREAVFTARDKGITAHAMYEEAESALFNALEDAKDPQVGG